jgi:transglutaminase-like putative cysteine protease
VTRYRVEHETVYEYADPVAISHNELRLVPRGLPHQRLRDVAMSIDPLPEAIAGRKDYFGNDVLFFALGEPHGRLAIVATSEVDRDAPPPPRLEASPPWETVAAAVRRELGGAWLEALELVLPSPFAPIAPALADYARPSFPPGRALLAGYLDLGARIHRDFTYDPEATSLSTPVLDVLRDRRGVCQDFAHLAIACLRSLGLPARYVSGYVRTRRADAPPGERALLGSDASHAWVSLFCPANGWIDFDPTNDVVPSDRHVTLAFGRDYDDVSPVKGVTVGGGAQTMTVRVELAEAR